MDKVIFLKFNQFLATFQPYQPCHFHPHTDMLVSLPYNFMLDLIKFYLDLDHLLNTLCPRVLSHFCYEQESDLTLIQSVRLISGSQGCNGIYGVLGHVGTHGTC